MKRKQPLNLTCFYSDERAVLRKFYMLRGQEWDDEEEIMDDYC